MKSQDPNQLKLLFEVEVLEKPRKIIIKGLNKTLQAPVSKNWNKIKKVSKNS